MSGQVFDVGTRVLLCRQCGAPYQVPDEGGYLTCEHCDSTIEVSRRPNHPTRLLDPSLDPDLDPEQRERARMKTLRAQEEAYDPASNPYAYYYAPEELEHLDPDHLDQYRPDAPQVVFEELQRAWKRCRDSRGSMTQQRQVYWLTNKLANLWRLHNEPLRSRAAVETGLELLSDPGYQQLLRCEMSGLARQEGDLRAAQEWLDRCDPRPEVLDLDTDFRTSSAMIQAQQGRWAKALELIGAVRGDIPHEPSHVAVFNALRAAIHESLGRPELAEAELTWLLNQRFPGKTFLRAMFEDSVVWEPCRVVWDRLRARFGNNPGQGG